MYVGVQFVTERDVTDHLPFVRQVHVVGITRKGKKERKKNPQKIDKQN